MHALFAPLLALVMFLAPDGGWLGVYLAADREEAVVTEVVPDSPAAKAGLKAGDVLIAVGDTATPTRDKLIATIGAASPGDRVSIKLKRDGKDTVVVVKLGNRPSEIAVAESSRPAPARRGQRPPTPAPESVPAPATPAAPAVPKPQDPAAAAGGVFLGIAIAESEGKLLIERVVGDSPAQAAGLKVGDQLVSIGDRKLGSLADLDRALRSARAGKPIAVGLRSEDSTRSVMVTPAARRENAVRGVDEIAIALDVLPAAPKPPVAASEPAPPAPVRAVRIGRRAPAAAQEPSAPPAAADARPAPRAVVRGRDQVAVTAPAAGTAATDVDRELEALRRELAELKKQLQELRKEIRGKGK